MIDSGKTQAVIILRLLSTGGSNIADNIKGGWQEFNQEWSEKSTVIPT